MSGDELADILADFTGKLYISMTPAFGDLEGDFLNTINSYWSTRKGDYKNMFDALTAHYDPISNYDMKESSLDGKKIDNITDTNIRSGSETEVNTPTGTRQTTTTQAGGTTTTETPSGSEKVTTTPSGSYAETETEAGGKKTTTTESKTTYDDTTNYKPAVKTETDEVPNAGNEKKTDHTFSQYKTEEETTFNQRMTTTDMSYKSGTQSVETETYTGRSTTDTTTYNNVSDARTINHTNSMSATGGGGSVSGAAEINQHFLERSGNVGVTTSQQMITSELELRYLNNLKYMFVREFITRFTY
jgi:hypothetical protein